MKILSEIYIDLNPNDELILIKKNRFFAYLSKKYRERNGENLQQRKGNLYLVLGRF